MYRRETNMPNGRTAKAALLIALGLASGFAKGNFQYSYIQAAYVFGEFDFDNADVSYKGYELTAQFELSPSIVAGVNYLSLEGNETESISTGVNTLEYEGDGINAYVLYYSPMTLRTHLLLGANLDMREFEARGQDVAPTLQTDEDTKFLFAGLRHQLQGLELQGQWSYNLDAEDDEDTWSYSLGVLSGEPGQFQLGFSVSPETTGDVMSVFVRQSY